MLSDAQWSSEFVLILKKLKFFGILFLQKQERRMGEEVSSVSALIWNGMLQNFPMENAFISPWIGSSIFFLYARQWGFPKLLDVQGR